MTHSKWMIALIGLAIAIIIGVIVFAVHDCNKKNECRKRGGTVEKYDCHMQTICTTINNIVTCSPQRVCKWRCIMPPPTDH